MITSNLVTDYLTALESADGAAVLALFTRTAIVHSPLYGDLPAEDFYAKLFADTAESRLTLRATMTGEHDGHPIVSFWFDFDWTLSDGTPAPFTVVDVAELDADGLIDRLHIIYDTAPIRGSFVRLSLDEKQRVVGITE